MIDNQKPSSNSQFQQHMAFRYENVNDGARVNFENSLSLKKILQSESSFKSKLTRILRKKLLDLIPLLTMNESKKCYLIHQATSIYDISELVDLVNDINTSSFMAQDFIRLKQTDHGFSWERVPFSIFDSV